MTNTPGSRSETLPVMERTDPYVDWRDAEGVPVTGGYYVEDMAAVPMAPWPRKGGRGGILNLDPIGRKDVHVVELAPAGKSEPEHHLYQELVYVVSGRGATSVWNSEHHKQTFEWAAGSLFAIPLNAWYQHFNGSGSEPALYVAVTSLPLAIRQYHNLDFIFNNPFVFEDRFPTEEGAFNGQGTLYQDRVWDTSFIPDARSIKLYEWRERGAGGSQVRLNIGDDGVGCHISRFQSGTYKKAHRHGPGAHLLILEGQGYSLLWQEGKERVKVDWKPGTLVVVPWEGCFHQHFNTGQTPARYLAITGVLGGGRRFTIPRPRTSDVSLEKGGSQLEYENEDPAIHELFEAELVRNGATCQMKALVPWCTGELGPTTEGEWGDD